MSLKRECKYITPRQCKGKYTKIASVKYDVRFRNPADNTKYVCKTFDKEQDAIKLVQKHFPEHTKTSMQMPEEEHEDSEISEEKAPGQLYKYVRWHAAVRKWLVQMECIDDGEAHYFEDEEVAARFAARSLNTTKQKLQLAKRSKFYGRQCQLRENFIDLMSIMGDAIPADAENMEEYANPGSKTISQILLDAPGLICGFVLAKHSHDRKVLDQAWTKLAKKKLSAPVEMPEADMEAYRVYIVLMEAARLLDGTRWSVSWHRHVGRGCDHYQRFCFYLVRIGMLKYRQAATCAHEGYTYHKSGVKYFPMPYDNAIQKKLQQTIAFGTVLQASDVPDTVKAWGSTVRHIDDYTGVVPGCAGNGKYMKLWVIRAWLLYSMRQQGKKQLEPGNDKMTSMMLAFPDQKAQLLLFASTSHKRGVGDRLMARREVKEMSKSIRYKGRLEYLSMWGCLNADNKLRIFLRKKPPGWLQDNRDRLRKVRTKFRRKHGHNPHTACVVLNKFL